MYGAAIFLIFLTCLFQLHTVHSLMFCNCSAGQTPQKMRQLYNSELLDIYCSQCCKKVNLLNDLEARLRNLKANRYNTHTHTQRKAELEQTFLDVRHTSIA